MDDTDLIAIETKIRHLFHRMEQATALLKAALEGFADDLAAHRGIDAALRSGGDDKPTVP
jgi:hypothetical protein